MHMHTHVHTRTRTRTRTRKKQVITHAVLIRLVLMWHHDAAELPPYSTNVSFAFSGEPNLNDHLAKETVDNSFEDRGCYPRMLAQRALRYHGERKCGQPMCGPDGGPAMWNQDGNFDAKAKKNQHDRRAPDADSDDEQSDDEGEGQQSEDEFVEELAREPLRPSNESEEVNALDVFTSAGVQGDALAGEPVESEMGGQGGDQDPVNHAPTPRDEEGEGNGEAGDGEEQVWHPYIRAIIWATAAEIAKIKPGTRTRIRIGTYASDAHTCTRIRTRTHMHTHSHARTCIYILTRTRTCTRMRTCSHAHTLVCSHTRTPSPSPTPKVASVSTPQS